MNILFVHETFGHFGGAESNIFATAAALEARGNRVALLAQKRSGKGERAWEQLFDERVFWLDDGVAHATAVSRPDVIYLHKWEDQPSLEILLGECAPIVRMVHDHDLYCLRSYRYHPLTTHALHTPGRTALHRAVSRADPAPARRRAAHPVGKLLLQDARDRAEPAL